MPPWRMLTAVTVNAVNIVSTVRLGLFGTAVSAVALDVQDLDRCFFDAVQDAQGEIAEHQFTKLDPKQSAL